MPCQEARVLPLDHVASICLSDEHVFYRCPKGHFAFKSSLAPRAARHGEQAGIQPPCCNTLPPRH